MFAVATQNVGQLGFTSKSKWASKELGAPLCARTHSAIFISEGREARAYETCLVGSRLRVAVGLLSLAAAGCWMQWHMHLVYRICLSWYPRSRGEPTLGDSPPFSETNAVARLTDTLSRASVLSVPGHLRDCCRTQPRAKTHDEAPFVRWTFCGALPCFQGNLL